MVELRRSLFFRVARRMARQMSDRYRGTPEDWRDFLDEATYSLGRMLERRRRARIIKRNRQALMVRWRRQRELDRVTP